MKVTKKPTKKRASNPRLPGLIALLILSSLLLAAFFLKDYNPALQQEAEGFTKLKQDFLDLQKEFNKIDQGWVYHEGCVGKGGVYESDIPDSCGMELTKIFDGQTSTLGTEKYIDLLKPSKRFSYSKDKDSLYIVKSAPLPSAHCALQAIESSRENESRYMTFGCSATTHYFHFPRTDR